jgi:diguanylate cyclase (GGDEF)-like protein/PAS domain S-box-containing protein
MSDIAEEYEALTQFLYMSPVGLAQIDVSGDFTLLNPVSAQLLMPLSRDGDLSNLFVALQDVAPDLRTLVDKFDRPHGMVCEGIGVQIDAGVWGKRDPRMLSLTLLKLDAHRLMAVLNDVSQQVKRERLLKYNEAWLSAILTGITHYAIVSLDAHGRIDDWNESIARVTGFTREQVLGQSYAIFYPDKATTPERVIDRLRDADQQGWSIDDGWRVRADGSRFWGTAMISPLRGLEPASELPGVQALIASEVSPQAAYSLVIRDITDRREASEKMRQATCCDHLTGVANRRAFFDAAELELVHWKRSPRPLSLAYFDADHFKQINDRHGHPVGDEVLRHLAQTLSRRFRAVDVVARVGGEEFAVLMPSLDAKQAWAAAEAVRIELAESVLEIDGHRIRYTVSGGVSTMSPGVQGLDALMKLADQQLYAAKAAGRNRIAMMGDDGGST